MLFSRSHFGSLATEFWKLKMGHPQFDFLNRSETSIFSSRMSCCRAG